MNFLKGLFLPNSSTQPQPKMYNINGQEYHELTLIAEGGYGFIWRAIEAKTRKICVLKKIICQSEEAIQQAKQEMNLHKSLNHVNVVKYLNGSIIYDKELQQTQAILILEICEGGTLIDLMKRYNEKRLNEKQVLLVLRQIVAGIKYLHSQNPPIQHRDLKVENILLHNKIFKICDFGSSSVERIDLATTSKLETSQCEELFSKYTTEIYRPPEMCDIYLKYQVNEKVDIWMLGCALYIMCFYAEPFQEASKLAIVQASYVIPKDSRFSDKMHDLIRIMLTPNPVDRPSIFEIDEILSDYEKMEPIKLNNFVRESKVKDAEFEQLQLHIVEQKNNREETDDFDEFQTGKQNCYDIIPILCLDIGGTLTKITFAAKKNYKLECKVHDNLTIHHLIENYNVYSLSHPNSMEVLNGWVKEMGLCGKIKKIYITGGGAFKYQEELSQYGELVKINEFEALKRGLFICQQVIQGGKGIFYIQSINSICASYSMLIFNQESIYPFLLVNIGSGVSILKFENKEEFTRISGTSLGGGMFLGLCHLFTGINDFDKLLQMSKQGSNEATDLLMDEMTLGFDSPTKNKNAAHVAVSLGKLQKSPNNVKQEDLVKSFLYMTTYNISQLAYMHSKLHNIERVLFSGHFIRNHTETLECIAQAFDYFSKVDGHPRYPYFITHDGFMGSLGAFVTAMQEEYKLL